MEKKEEIRGMKKLFEEETWKVMENLEQKLKENAISFADIENIIQEDNFLSITLKNGEEYIYDIENQFLVLGALKNNKNRLTEEERNKYAEENLGLVGHVVKNINGMAHLNDELIGIGMLGLAKALKTFDKSKNIKFSTYATTCIRNEIFFFLRKEQKYQQNTVSMNKIVATDQNGRDLEVMDLIEEENKNLEEIIINIELRDIILQAMEHLREEERFILIYRYGLDKGIIKTQNEIAKTIHMSQANVSKMQKSSLIRLKLFLRNYIKI